ncbi:Predicted amidohydrolase [Colwellia chukchiensis]|uniref:Predicted amidohydrolase n=1 Tax=Colwellia chukchiensis TaxID=641665 RepID=A0A1H7SI80_9GAMM|nr:carbon-nitrogen hydrolase family protein [Colwellia chukchiensis]SEL72342.1 Predicted amidohydrolase [Colwellia chukchiensis]
MSLFNICCLQLNLDTGENLAIIDKKIAKAMARYPWIDMVILPELVVFGSGNQNAIEMPSSVESSLCDIAKKYGIWFIPGSLIEKSDDKLYNTAPVINPEGEVVTRYRKLYPYYPYEAGITSGSEFTVFDVPEIGRFGVTICYDKWFPEVARTLSCMGAEVILHPTMTYTIDRDIEISISRATAATNQVYFLDVNSCGGFSIGRSVVFDAGGNCIYEAGSDEEIIPVEVDFSMVRRVRQRGYHGLTQVLKSFNNNPLNYPFHQGKKNSDYIDNLGPLTIPMRHKATK